MKKVTEKTLYSLVVLAIISFSCARSATLLQGGNAERVLENEVSLFVPGNFTYEEMRDCRRGKLTLAVFNRDEGEERGGNFQWIVLNKNRGDRYVSESWNVILLDSAAGERGKNAPPDKLEEIENSQLSPVLIMDDEKEVRAVIYKPASLGVNAFIRADGTIRLELGRRTVERGNILYTFEIK